MFSGQGFALLTLEVPVTVTNPLEIQLSQRTHLFSMNEGKLKLPSCGVGSEYSARSSGGNFPKNIILDPVDNELSTIWKGNLKDAECPALPKSCPSCEEMNDDELEELICSSDKGELFAINMKM